MKTKIKNAVSVSLLLLGLLTLAPPAQADPQGWATFPLAVTMQTNASATVNASATNAYYDVFAGKYATNIDYSLPVPQNSQLVFQSYAVCANGTDAALANLLLNLDIAANGDTNFSTTLPLSIPVNTTGTNACVNYVVVNWTNVTGAARFRVDQMTSTQTNAFTALGLRVGFKNVSTAGY